MIPTAPFEHASLNVLPYRAILSGGDGEARQAMVMSLFESGRPDAQVVLRQALLDPDERIRLLAAQALEKLTQTFLKAAQNHRRAIEQDPSDPYLKISFAQLLFNRAAFAGQTDAGLADQEEAARLVTGAIAGLRGAELHAAYALLGKIHAKVGRTAEAREFLDRVPESAPDYVRSRILWAETWLVDGDIGAARMEMRRVAALAPTPDLAAAAKFWEA